MARCWLMLLLALLACAGTSARSAARAEQPPAVARAAAGDGVDWRSVTGYLAQDLLERTDYNAFYGAYLFAARPSAWEGVLAGGGAAGGGGGGGARAHRGATRVGASELRGAPGALRGGNAL